MRNLFLGCGALLLALLFSTAVFARGYGPSDQRMMGYGQGQYQQGWGQGPSFSGGMSPEQQQALQEAYARHQEAVETLSAKLYAKQAELNALLSDSKSSQKEIDRTVGEINELRSALYKEQVAIQMELRKQGLPYGCPGMGQGLGYGMGSKGGGHGWGGGMMGPGGGGMMGPGWGGGGMMGPGWNPGPQGW